MGDSAIDGGHLSFMYVQANEVYEEEWVIQSLDIVLGLVGGFTGLLWSVTAMIIGGYESFKFESSLIGALYSTSPEAAEKPKTEEEAKFNMINAIAKRGEYSYNYPEYLYARLTRFICCCSAARKSARIAKLKRHEKATELLANEIDIVKILSLQRISEFT